MKHYEIQKRVVSTVTPDEYTLEESVDLLELKSQVEMAYIHMLKLIKSAIHSSDSADRIIKEVGYAIDMWEDKITDLYNQYERNQDEQEVPPLAYKNGRSLVVPLPKDSNFSNMKVSLQPTKEKDWYNILVEGSKE